MNKKSILIFSIYLFVALLVAIPTTFMATVCNVFAQQRSSIKIGLVGEIDPIDPNESVNQNTQAIIPQIYETLISSGESMTLKPLLATSWKVASDGTAITFSLRKGVKFHDGSPFDAKAVKVTFDRIMNEKLKRLAVFASFLKSVEIIDQYTVKINLLGPSAPLALSVLSLNGQIECPAAIEKFGKNIGLHPIGTGPYKYVEWVPDQRVVLEANKAYWGGEPKTSQIIFMPVPDEQTRAAMLETGDIDVAIRVPYTAIDRLKSLPKIRVDERISGSIFFVAFNAVKDPTSDKRVRQAISYSIDRKGIVNTLLFGRAHLAETYATPGKHIFKYNIYPYNPEKAKSILASLGWKPGKSGFLEKDGKVFEMGLLSSSGRYPMDRQIAEAIQAQLKKVGIDLKITILESGAFVKAVMGDRQAKQDAEFGMLLVSRPMGPDPDNAFYQHFHSSSVPPRAVNASIFSNAKLDRALEAGSRTLADKKRDGFYKEAQDILNEEVPWLPIYTYVDFMGFNKGVKGVGYHNPFSFLEVSKDAQLVSSK